jgi:hypothetical protein
MQKIALFVLGIVIISACSNKNGELTNKGKPIAPIQTRNGDSPEAVSIGPFQIQTVDYKVSKASWSKTDQSIPKPVAHEKYISDPLVFAQIPDQSIHDASTAVVGSDVCMFYPDALPSSLSDLANLPKGTPVPIGTILPITGDRLLCADGNHYGTGMFQFQDNWNWFYPTKYQGKSGIVFGSDLAGLQEDIENNRVTALLYTTSGKYQKFYPILGYKYLDKKILDRLETERLAIQAVTKDEYGLYASTPDDMISLYLNHRENEYGYNIDGRRVPVFITTDLLSHSRHLIFDRTIQHLEEDFFFPRLRTLCDRFIVSLEKGFPKGGVDTAVSAETREKAILYFQVAKAILDTAPEKIIQEDSWGRKEIAYKDHASLETILATYPEMVRKELELMRMASGFENSPVFTFNNGTKSREDYSQYRPRGHYTKNGILESYFKAMMWFGRIHFLIAAEGPSPLNLANGEQPSNATELTLAMQPIALLITELVRSDSSLFNDWSALFDPITSLIGASDDLSFYELGPLWAGMKVDDFNNWISDKENLLSLMKKAQEKIRPPAISGSSVFWGPSSGDDRSPPMGWRLFGQRFTWDSWIHHRVSPPRLMTRDMVRGLDIMKVFGSAYADTLLQSTDYPKMEGLKERLDGLEEVFTGRDIHFWNSNYYTQVLNEIRALATFESGSGFYFTEGEGWNVKSMLTAHGAWAELRHDTLLYVKQSYAERAGDGDFEPTFRTKPVPNPVHYIEPNLAYWYAALNATETLIYTLAEYSLMTEESASSLQSLEIMLHRIIDIVRLEIADKTVEKKDLLWIPTIPAELAKLILIHVGRGDIMTEDQLQMALVADVFTNAELSLVLETAVGIPYRIYVPLNDSQGGKRIAVGYCFSYYEFNQPMSNRLTNEEWKKRVYNDNPAMASFEPFWTKGRIIPAQEK